MKGPLLHGLAALVLFIAACGGEEKLSNSEEFAVAEATLDLANFCVEQTSEGTGNALRAERAADRLVRVYQDKPDAKYEGDTMEQLLADEASHVEGCGGPTVARRLDRARDAGP